jgi:hypothetical protein
MRLGQMARKLGVSQSEIVRYLSSQNLEIEDGSNVKLGESHVRSLYGRYAPEELHAPVEKTQSEPGHDDQTVIIASESMNHAPELPGDPSAQTAPPKAEATENDAVEAGVLQGRPGSPSTTPTTETTSTDHLAEQPETIRAPKVELAGLKVLGKIDLPEPKKKETPVLDEAATPEGIVTSENGPTQEDPKPRVDRREEGRRRGESRGQDDRRRTRTNQSRDQRQHHNPIAAQRERELEAERDRQKKKAAEDKERRTQNYQNRVKHSPPTKAARIFEEQVEVMNSEVLNPQPVSWFGKFVKWLKS